ncbi:MAG TPA: GNAT family N-acetyltransferase [Polyangia bacterium]
MARRLLLAGNDVALVRSLKRRVPVPGVRVRHLRTPRDATTWARWGWLPPGYPSELVAACCAHPPEHIAVLATWLAWEVGGAHGSPLWSQRGLPGWWLGGVWLHSALRGMGIGERLVAAVEEASVALGHDELLLNVAADNVTARRLYAKLGFADFEQPRWTDVIEAHFARFDCLRPQVLMRKRLARPRV